MIPPHLKYRGFHDAAAGKSVNDQDAETQKECLFVEMPSGLIEESGRPASVGWRIRQNAATAIATSVRGKKPGFSARFEH